MKIIDLTGKRFGHWEVLHRVPSCNKQTMWHCRCDCGNEVDVDGYSLRSGKSTQCKACHGKDNASKRRKDLRGKKFGKLTVISRAPDRKGRTFWHCKCDCGNEVVVSAHNLLRDTTKSCGCIHKERVREALFKDLTGKRFGRLVVLELSEKTTAPNGNATTYWKCKCDCGNVVDVRGSLLSNGDTQSCGCLHRQRTSETSFQDLTGQHFGMLTAMHRTEDKKNAYGRPIVVWRCKCDCGNETDVRAGDLKSNNVLSCGCLNSYGEQICHSFLEQQGLHLKRNKTFEDLRGNKGRKLPYDFYVPKFNLLIEVQGDQHYRKVFNMTDEQISERIQYDFMKYQYAKEHGFDILYLRWNRKKTASEIFLSPLIEYIEDKARRAEICYRQAIKDGGAFIEAHNICE